LAPPQPARTGSLPHSACNALRARDSASELSGSWFSLRRPSEEYRIEPRLLQAPFQPSQAIRGKAYMLLFVRAGQQRARELQFLPADEIDDVPSALQFGQDVVDWLSQVDEDGEKLFIEAAGEGVPEANSQRREK